MIALPGKEPESDLVPLLERLEGRLEAMNLGAYVDLYLHPARLLGLSFLAGLMRGIGAGVGFTLVGALLISLLRVAFWRNLPGIGAFLAHVTAIVQEEIRVGGGA